MNVHSPLRLDRAAFFTWVEGRVGRYELAKGQIAMMTGDSRAHGTIVRRLANALESRIDTARWEVWTSDFAVEVGPDTVRYPDVVIDVAGAPPKDLAARSPILVGEVLSPSSVTIDLGDKAAEYLRLESLMAYIVPSQDEPKAWVWVRDAAGFAAGPEVIVETDGMVRLTPLGVELPLADIYKGVEPR